MSAAAPTTRRDLDWLLALCAGLVGAAAFGLLFRDLGGIRHPERPALARLDEVASEVRRRPRGTLVWEDLAAGAPLWEGDALFVPRGGAATVVFKDGTRLKLDQNTLVALEPRARRTQAPTVRLERGQVLGESGAKGLALRTGGGVALLDEGSKAQLRREASGGEVVDVLAGTARVGDGERLGPMEYAVRDGKGWEQGRRPVQLLEPGPMSRHYVHRGETAEVLLRWQGSLGARAFVAVTRVGEDAPLFRAPGRDKKATFAAPGPGAYAVQVRTAAGKPLSEERRFTVVEDRPPRIVTPRHGEIVAGYLDQKVPFAWTRVDGVQAYELEVSNGPAFEKVVHAQEVKGTGLRLAWRGAEGRYYFRVRAADEARGESPWSRAASFRYLTRPVPDAPELSDPELELELDP